MKKILLILTALLAVLSLLAACGKADPAPTATAPTSPSSLSPEGKMFLRLRSDYPLNRKATVNQIVVTTDMNIFKKIE